MKFMGKPTDVLTPFQLNVLKVLSKEPLLKDFYLTGGTALAAFYLQHRLSEDLDFFTETPGGIGRVPPLLKRITRQMKAKLVLGRRFETLFECALVRKTGEKVEMDFALDMPGRLKPILRHKSWGLRVDNRTDIACNKLSALYERSEPKDFVDVYWIHKRFLRLDRLIRLARQKYPGLDDYGLAMAFLKVKDITLWPRMLVPFKERDLRDFYIREAKQRSKDIFRNK